MSFPQWKGLWDWSIKHADGTGAGLSPKEVDPEKMKWLDEALKHYMVDFSARMQEIKTALQRDTTTTTASGGDQCAGSGATHAAASDQAPAQDLEEREALLDELMDIVSSIDYARDLHKIGGLPVLLELLQGPHPSLQWRAAEVVATCVASNPPVQQWFLEGGVLPHLLQLAAPSQPNATVRGKALLALSGLVRHFAPGLQAFRDAGGLSILVGCLGCPDRRVSRKAMTLLTYLLAQRRSDCSRALQHGALLPLLAELQTRGGGGAAPAANGADDSVEAEASSQEASDMRQAALGALLQLASHSATWAEVREAPGLRPRLAELAVAHRALPDDERDAQAEELGLLERLAELLAAAAPPAAPPPDEADHVSVEAFEESGRGTTFSVNEPRPAAVADAGAGAGDQRVTAVAAAAAAVAEQGTQAAAPATPAGPPLLLGAP